MLQLRGGFHLRTIFVGSMAVIAVALWTSSIAAQTTRPTANSAVLPPSELPAGWDEVDQRLVFLTVELSGVETSLNAIDKAIHVSGYQQSVKKREAENYRKGNELMDRNGGGPVPWNQFYGRAAESFFYHPTRKSVYINPSPKPQRPPQLDYIYRANADNQQRAEAEAAAMANHVDQLLTRKRQLEREQAALWCKIAMRALASRELMHNPLYVFEPQSPAHAEEAQRQRTEFARAGCDFMRTIERAAEDASEAVDGDQAAAFKRLKETCTSARDRLAGALVHEPLLLKESEDNESNLAQFSKAVGQIQDCAQNVSDSSRLANQSEADGDEGRKQQLRGQLQQNLIKFSEMALKADQEMASLARQWDIVPDTSKVIAPAEKAAAEPKPRAATDRLPVASNSPVSKSNDPAVENKAHAPEADQIVAEVRSKYPEALGNAKEVTLVQYHDATEMKRHAGAPQAMSGSFSSQAVAGHGRGIMLYGISDNLPAGRYLIVYRVQDLTIPVPPGDRQACFLDICIRGKTVASARPTGRELQPKQWSDVPVVVNLRQSRILEYRLWPNDRDIALDRIYVLRLGASR